MVASESTEESLSAKVLGKRKAPNGHLDESQTSAAVSLIDQRRLAFELIDCHGILDAALPDRADLSLRKLLQSEVDRVELEAAVAAAYTLACSQSESLPGFPFNPTEPQYKNAPIKRTMEELALVQEIGEARQILTDKAAARQEQLDEWLRRAHALASGSVRGVQGKGSIARDGAVKSESIASSSKRRVLHRSIAGAYDVFTSASSGELSKHTLQAMKHMTDTDVLVDAELPASSSLRLPAIKLGAVNVPLDVYEDDNQRAADPFPVDFLSYGPFDSFAPSYDSAHSTMSYLASVKLKRARDNARKELKKPLVLDETDSSSLLPRLAQTAALLKRVQVSQLNRIRSDIDAPTAEESEEAHRLHEGLAALIDEAAGQGLDLDVEALRALHPGATRPGFYGILDSRSSRGVREGLLNMLPPPK